MNDIDRYKAVTLTILLDDGLPSPAALLTRRLTVLVYYQINCWMHVEESVRCHPVGTFYDSLMLSKVRYEPYIRSLDWATPLPYMGIRVCIESRL